MPEKINIATLGLDISDVQKASSDYLVEIERLKKSQKELDKSTEVGRVQFNNQKIELDGLNKAYKNSQKESSALAVSSEKMASLLSIEGKSVNQLRSDRAELNNIINSTVASTEEEKIARQKIIDVTDEQTKVIKENSTGYSQQAQNVGNYTESILEANREEKAQIKLLKDTEQELKKNQKETKKGSVEYDEYSDALEVVNKDLAKLGEETAETSEGIDIGSQSFSQFSTVLVNGGDANKAFSTGLKAAAKSLGTLTKAAFAFIATPLGAVIAALVLVVESVSLAFSSSEEGQNKWNKITIVASAIFGNFIDILADLGELLISIFENPQEAINDFVKLLEENVINRFNGLLELIPQLSKAMSLLWDGEFNKAAVVAGDAVAKVSLGINSLSTSIDGAIDATKAFALELEKEAKLAIQVADMRAKSDVIDRELLTQRAKLESEIADLRLKARKEDEFTANEQKEFLNEAIRLKNIILDQEVKSAKLKFDAQTIENSFSKSDKEAKDKAAQAEADLNNIQTKRLNAQKEIQRELNTLNKKTQKDIVDANKKAAEESIEIAEVELNEYIKINKTKVDENKIITEDILTEEINRLNKIAEKQKEYAELELLNGTTNLIEYNNSIKEINLSNDEEIAELKEIKREQDELTAAIDAQNRLDTISENANNEYELKRQELERQKNLEVANAESTGADISIIEAKYAAKSTTLSNEVSDNKIDGANDVLGDVSNVLNAESKAGKAAAIAQTTISTYQAAQAAYASYAAIPVVGVPLGIAAGAAAVVSGLQNVDAIISTPDPQILRRGGVLNGNTHENGGIPFTIDGQAGFEAEGGESLMNAVSTRKHIGLLSAISQDGGGVPMFVNGGTLNIPKAPLRQSALIDYNALANIVVEGVKNLPPMVVGAVEITEQQNRINVINSTSNL